MLHSCSGRLATGLVEAHLAKRTLPPGMGWGSCRASRLQPSRLQIYQQAHAEAAIAEAAAEDGTEGAESQALVHEVLDSLQSPATAQCNHKVDFEANGIEAPTARVVEPDFVSELPAAVDHTEYCYMPPLLVALLAASPRLCFFSDVGRRACGPMRRQTTLFISICCHRGQGAITCCALTLRERRCRCRSGSQK